MFMYGLTGREYEERYGEEVGHCNIHKVQVVDRSCMQCEDDWVCLECNDIKYNDTLVAQGLKCFSCTYENRGGE